MPVTAIRADHNHDQPEHCRICRAELHGTRLDAFYCSDACKMIAYRRRNAQRRQRDQEIARRKEQLSHQHTWVQLFIDGPARLSRRDAQRIYEQLHELGRLDGMPFDQLALDLKSPR